MLEVVFDNFMVDVDDMKLVDASAGPRHAGGGGLFKTPIRDFLVVDVEISTFEDVVEHGLVTTITTSVMKNLGLKARISVRDASQNIRKKFGGEALIRDLTYKSNILPSMGDKNGKVEKVE
ncbi:unnamed protein product [Sphenostylis stenocarpa]|uniref:Uncharacterized protein n=1 Tax=Sphenostylis stenocarpa TaxID=92480 RepID=A0AA86W0R7_9FABA|nr:unnamed protein product [Sphenostylis stenocarpa]